MEDKKSESEDKNKNSVVVGRDDRYVGDSRMDHA